jgi:putative ABC transport system substrate-binding protein
VDAIVTGGPQATRVAKDATTTIPIVMAVDYDPVGAGFVACLAYPGGNVTGLSAINPQLSGKRLELLKEAVPRLSRIAVLWDPMEPNATAYLEGNPGGRSGPGDAGARAGRRDHQVVAC